MNILVSIIITTYNTKDWVFNSIDSCLSQNHFPFEIIVVDDGSTDSTGDLLTQRYGNKIKYIYQSNCGPSGARNTGLRHASGDYIQFLDSDDLIHSEKIEKQVHQLKLIEGLAISISDYYCCDIDDIEKKPYWHQPVRFVTDSPVQELVSRWEHDLCIPIHCFLFDARIFKDHMIFFDEKLPNHEDWDCWMRVFSLKPQIMYHDDQLAIYRVKQNSLTRNRVKMRAGYLQALNKQRSLFRNDPEIVQLIDAKVKDVKLIYRDVSPALRIWNAIPRAIRSRVPWRIRKYFE